MVNLGPEAWDPGYKEPQSVGDIMSSDEFLRQLLKDTPVEHRHKVDSTPLPVNMAAPASTKAEQTLLMDDVTSMPKVYDSKCYICRDPEYAQMGMPLCRPCPKCLSSGKGDGHIPADDTVCTDCGYDEYEEHQNAHTV